MVRQIFVAHRRAPYASLLTLLAAAMLCPGVAVAQGSAEGPSPAPRHQLGPFALSPVVAVQDVGIDSNVYNRDDGQTADFTFIVRPAVEATARSRRGVVTLRSATELVYFAREESERSVNEDAAAAAQLPFRRLTLLAAVSYLNTRQRPNEEIDARSRRVERGGDAGVRFALTPKVSLGIAGRSARTRFRGDAMFAGTDLAEELNRDVRTVTGSLRYVLTPLTTLLVTHDASRIRFVDAVTRDARSRQTSAGLELNPRALIGGVASFGYQRFRSIRGTLPDFSGPVGAAALSYRLAPQTRVGIAYQRLLAYSYSEIDPYYVRTGFGASLRRQLANRWDVEVSAGRYRHRYRTMVAAVDVAPPRADALLDAGVEVGYQPRPGSRIVVALTYLSRESTISSSNYHNARLATSFAYAF